LPEKVIFGNINNFKDELIGFLGKFHKTRGVSPETPIDNIGYPLHQTRNTIISYIQDYKFFLDNLLQCPWRANVKYVRSDVKKVLQKKLDDKMMHKLLATDADAYNVKQNVKTGSTHYQFVYVKAKATDICISNGTARRIAVIYVFGKKQDGSIELFAFLQNAAESMDELGMNLKEQGMKDADMFILSARRYAIFNNMRNSLSQYYPEAKYQRCAGSIYDELLKLRVDLTNENIACFENMLYQKSKRDAQSLLDDYFERIPEYIYKKLKNQFDSIEGYYQYLPKDRVLICTAIIVEYVHIIIAELIKNISFHNIEMALAYIKTLSQRVLDNGKNLIPNWERLTVPVRAKS
jgi:hypothetical protein